MQCGGLYWRSARLGKPRQQLALRRRQFIDYSSASPRSRAARWWAAGDAWYAFFGLAARRCSALFAAQPGGVPPGGHAAGHPGRGHPARPGPAAADAAARSNGSSTRGRNASRCAAIRRALLSGPRSVDFVLADRSRVRAEFDEDCPALDFYGGFYLQPEDDRLCAKRDAIHSRMGGSCRSSSSSSSCRQAQR